MNAKQSGALAKKGPASRSLFCRSVRSQSTGRSSWSLALLASLRPGACLLCFFFLSPYVCFAASRRQSAEEWRRLTATNQPLPKVMVRDDEVRFYFPDSQRPIGFKAD